MIIRYTLGLTKTVKANIDHLLSITDRDKNKEQSR
jgi:hypothetical protein